MGETSGPRSKVQRVIDEYELTGMGEQLEAYWTGDGEVEYSLRELADVFNRAVLRAALDRAGASPLEGEVENTYRLLTDDSVSSGVRTETRNALARDGVAVEELEDDFVTHQAVHTYLTKHRGVEYESGGDETDQVEKGAETIQRLRSRTSAVAETTLENLESTDRIALGDFDVFVDVRVLCDTCGRSYTVDDLLEDGGCACAESE
ncbi:rod-determining factor RdfA [Halomicrococcus gelatinilyticus]|uniref:rod-determining factor RdfA n=1 Tax=Halomicrococcus gelatinilyticus TaxID=1702103 RepID=UPI002E14D46F|nr:rod-determining factor RdfA [Halomicrococcus gelatinilyticus]